MRSYNVLGYSGYISLGLAFVASGFKTYMRRMCIYIMLLHQQDSGAV